MHNIFKDPLHPKPHQELIAAAKIHCVIDSYVSKNKIRYSKATVDGFHYVTLNNILVKYQYYTLVLFQNHAACVKTSPAAMRWLTLKLQAPWAFGSHVT